VNRIIDPIARETTDAYEAMMANEAALDESVAAFVRANCKKKGIQLRRISRCGSWYLEEEAQLPGGKLLQCSVVRLSYRGPSGKKQTSLREYAIRCGDRKATVFELLA
jgi:hypothetical protein